MVQTDVAPDQKATALLKANLVRSERVHRRLQIRVMGRAESCEEVARAIEELPAWVRSMPVAKLLHWARSSEMRAVDYRFARRWMMMAEVRNEVRPVGMLSDRQRRLLVEQLREWACLGERAA